MWGISWHWSRPQAACPPLPGLAGVVLARALGGRGVAATSQCQPRSARCSLDACVTSLVQNKSPAGKKLLPAQTMLLVAGKGRVWMLKVTAATLAYRFISQNSSGTSSRHTLFPRHPEKVVNAGSAFLQLCSVIRSHKNLERDLLFLYCRFHRCLKWKEFYDKVKYFSSQAYANTEQYCKFGNLY